MRTRQQFALTFVVLSLLGSRACAAITSTDQIFTRLTDSIFTDGELLASTTAVDYDGDGWPDIYLGNEEGTNVLYRNNGNGTFARTNVVGVATDPGKTVSAAWGDYNNDGFPDLVVANWPDAKNFQYRNNGDGTFTKVTQGPLVTQAGEFIGCVWGDYDRDGWPDLFVAMFAGNHRLYHNNRDGTFSRATDLPTVGPGGSTTFVDYDNDGFPDLFVAGWLGSKNALYHNNGGRSFTRITNSTLATEGGMSIATIWGDYDNDGFADLFVASGNFDNGQYQNFLYHNSGDGTFTKVTTGAIATGTGDSAGGAWADVDNDGDLDLLVTNLGQNEFFYLNNGDGTFKDVSESSGVSRVQNRYSMTATTLDFNNDGWTDIYVACDSTASTLYRNNRDGTFTDVAVEAGCAYNEDGNAQAGMGVAVGDYNGDGLSDIFKTHFSDDLPALYRNSGRNFFEDASRAAGFEHTRHVEWGTGFADFDNDGWPDIMIATGSVYPEVEKIFKEYPHRGPRLVYQNLGNGRFKDVSTTAGPGVQALKSSRGCAFGDFDNDGDVDVLIMNMNEPPQLLRNDYNTERRRGPNNWLKVELTGTKSNRTAIGARVIVRADSRVQAQEVTSQSSYYSHNDLRLHFGMGTSRKADHLEIRWPNGQIETVKDVAVNQVVKIKEGIGVMK